MTTIWTTFTLKTAQMLPEMLKEVSKLPRNYSLSSSIICQPSSHPSTLRSGYAGQVDFQHMLALDISRLYLHSRPCSIRYSVVLPQCRISHSSQLFSPFPSIPTTQHSSFLTFLFLRAKTLSMPSPCCSIGFFLFDYDLGFMSGLTTSPLFL